MSVEIKEFGVLPSGEKIDKITLRNSDGFEISLINYGARLTNCIYDGVDVVLGFDNIYGYIPGTGYVGAVIGRYGNRIEKGRFTLNGKNYFVGCNESGKGHLHGGIKGFDKKVWDYSVFDDEDCPAVTFSMVSPDKDMGYPGNLTVKVCYSLSGSSFTIAYNSTTDKDTVTNITNHSYFNLNGYDGENVLNTELMINADYITPVNVDMIPTGQYLPVEGTPFDFRKPKPIGKDINDTHPQMLLGKGFDHNFVLGTEMEERVAAVAHSPITGITMTVTTDQLSVQFYTANWLHEPNGKGGKNIDYRQGFCLETQHFPASPNRENFPSTVLKAGESFKTSTTFAFSKD